MCESAMQTWETELYKFCRSIFDSFEKIVVFEVVPDAWMTKLIGARHVSHECLHKRPGGQVGLVLKTHSKKMPDKR